MGFIRKATIVGTLGGAKVAGVKGKSKKERNAEANEKMAKIEGKRFKEEQRTAKAEQKAAKAQQQAAKAKSITVNPAVKPAVKPAVVTAVPSVQTAQTAQTASSPTAVQGPPPGWYLDPDGLDVQRWWDGTKWTDVTQPMAVSAGGTVSETDSPETRLELMQRLHDAIGMRIVASSAFTAIPQTLTTLEGDPVEVSSVQAIPQGIPVDDTAGEGEFEGTAPDESGASEGYARPLLFGQVACDDQTVTFVTNLWGKDNIHHLKLAKMGRKPVKIKQGKNGMLDMTVAPGALAMKGLTVDRCTANLIEIAAFRPDVSVDVPSVEVAEALVAGGVSITIQVVS